MSLALGSVRIGWILCLVLPMSREGTLMTLSVRGKRDLSVRSAPLVLHRGMNIIA
jgi:hypothetical protein